MARLGIAGGGSGMGTTSVSVPKNMIDQQEELKSWPDERLLFEMQEPSGSAPQFLVFTEVNRRKDMRNRYQQDQSRQDMPQMSMAQEAVAQVQSAAPPQPPMGPP